ncbi:NAD dependent epimerase/dehydratase family protein [Pseudomonas sp. GM102]|uniref:NAD-dependent epimerase/dehydratase family protein n=1 Tax=Pseudomonas sp. GM102 TaxID=1144321 RepID=UPI00026F54AD|nr:NAD(P)-dependent oxidoreductase [Pseudomonas sp. GM102]EJM03043.1 NAD dependent epimerase/dehydratase family protein [Pseudomonas sp. GM102]
MKTLLITGAAGGVATRIRPLLRNRYRLRLLDRIAAPDLQDGETRFVADLSNQASVLEACEGVDAVIHLACAHSLDISFEATLDANYRGTLHLLDACQRSGIERFVFASSHHVLGQHLTEDFAGDEAPIAPDGFYALSKVFGEGAVALYAYRTGLRALNIRIGSAGDTAVDARRLRLWVSIRDLVQLIDIGLNHPDLRCDTVYGVSRCPDGLFANARAHALGYRPQDLASEHLADDFVVLADMSPNEGAGFVGGPYIPHALKLA